MSAPERVQLALAVLGFPAYWPLVAARNAVLGARYRALATRRAPATDALPRVAAGEVKRATIHLRSFHTIASGFETEGLVELEVGEGRLVTGDTEALRAALAEAKVPTTTIESEEAQLGGMMAWIFWLLLGLAVATLWDHAWVLWALGGSTVAGLVAFALRPRNQS